MTQRISGPNDPVRDYLRRSGAPHSVVTRGLRGLVENWERVVQQVLEGYPLTLDDYLNDMDGRQLLANALELAPAEVRDAFLPRVAEADRVVRLHLTPAARCLWGGIVAAEEGWDPEVQWWYFEKPRVPGPALKADLDGP